MTNHYKPSEDYQKYNVHILENDNADDEFAYQVYLGVPADSVFEVPTIQTDLPNDFGRRMFLLPEKKRFYLNEIINLKTKGFHHGDLWLMLAGYLYQIKDISYSSLAELLPENIENAIDYIAKFRNPSKYKIEKECVAKEICACALITPSFLASGTGYMLFPKTELPDNKSKNLNTADQAAKELCKSRIGSILTEQNIDSLKERKDEDLLMAYVESYRNHLGDLDEYFDRAEVFAYSPRIVPLSEQDIQELDIFLEGLSL